jgi:hypothetical protein
MSTKTNTLKQQPEQISGLIKFFSSLFIGLVIFLGTILIFSISLNVLYKDQIFPGIKINSIDVSGLTLLEAAKVLTLETQFIEEGRINLLYDDQNWEFSPLEMGFMLDAEASSVAAYSIGRQGLPWKRLKEQFQSIRDGYILSPRFILDGEQIHSILTDISEEINKKTIEAELSVNGLEVNVSEGQIGLALDTTQSANLISAR